MAAKADALGGVRYLTFAGGGGKGIVYLGVIKAIEEAMHGKARDRSWTRIQEPWAVPYWSESFPPEAFPDTPIIDTRQPISERPIIGISGASAGAITAFMLALGMSSRMIFRTIESIAQRRLGTGPKNVSPFETFFGAPHESRLRAVRENGVTEEEPFTENRFGINAIEALAGGIVGNVDRFNTKPFEPRSIAMQRIFETSVVSLSGGPSRSGVGVFASSLLSGFGLFTGLEVRPFFEDLLTKQLLDGIDQGLWTNMFGLVPKKASQVTFAMFMRMTGVDLVITGTNISTKRPVVFSYGNTPDFPVTEAVGLSMSIPILFKPVLNHARVIEAWGRDDQYNVRHYGYYVDGGMLNNVPLHVFDHCIPQVLHRQLVREVGPVAWSPDRAQAEGWSEERLVRESVSRNTYKAIAFVFKESSSVNLAQQASESSWPAISVYVGELLDTLLYSANAGQYQSATRREEVVEVDPNGIATADFSNITLDARRSLSPLGSVEPNRSRTKMMAIMNAYNTTWDRIE